MNIDFKVTNDGSIQKIMRNSAIYSVSPKQALALVSRSKIIVPIGGRRLGKSEVGAKATVKHMVEYSNGHTWIVGPDYPTLRIAERKLFALLPRDLIVSYDKTTRSGTLVNGHLFEFRSVSDPDSARGVGLTWIWADEAALYHKDAHMNLMTCLSDRGGQMIITTTPRGYHSWVRDVVGDYANDWQRVDNIWKFKRAKIPLDAPVQVIRFTSFENPFIQHRDISALKEQMDEDFYAQEVLGEFVMRGVGLVFKVNREVNFGDVQPNAGAPFYIFQDFNIAPMTSIIAQPTSNGFNVVGEVISRDADIEEHCQLLKTKGYGPGTVVVCDPAGRSRTANSRRSCVNVMEHEGYKVYCRKYAIPKEDSLNAVRALLRNAMGKSRLVLNPRLAPKTCEAIEKQPYKENSMELNKSLGFDHCVDALSYGCEWFYPVRFGQSVKAG